MMCVDFDWSRSVSIRKCSTLVLPAATGVRAGAV
jgi:hypothetical protein